MPLYVGIVHITVGCDMLSSNKLFARICHI